MSIHNALSYEAYLEYNKRLIQECELLGKTIKFVDFNAQNYVAYCHVFKEGNLEVFEENTNHLPGWMHLSQKAEDHH